MLVSRGQESTSRETVESREEEVPGPGSNRNERSGVDWLPRRTRNQDVQRVGAVVSRKVEQGDWQLAVGKLDKRGGGDSFVCCRLWCVVPVPGYNESVQTRYQVKGTVDQDIRTTGQSSMLCVCTIIKGGQDRLNTGKANDSSEKSEARQRGLETDERHEQRARE